MSKDLATAFQYAREANITRYRKLLDTHFTDIERAFVKRRLAEEQSALQQITRSAEPTRTSVGAA